MGERVGGERRDILKSGSVVVYSMDLVLRETLMFGCVKVKF